MAVLSVMTGCLYTNVRTPGWYYSQNYGDIKGMQIVGRMTGEACSNSYLYLIYTGDESYEAAVGSAVEGKADLLFNVQTDYAYTSFVFGFYAKKCTRVSGIGVKFPAGVLAPASTQSVNPQP